MILTVNIHPTAIKVARSGQGGRNVSLEFPDASGSTLASIFPGTVEGWDALIAAAIEGRAMQEQADTDHAIAADVDEQIRRDGEALGRRVAADEGIEPKADPVPWPTGFCGDPVPPGAWDAGFYYCRDHTTVRRRDLFDEAAAPDLTVVDTPARPEDLDDADGES